MHTTIGFIGAGNMATAIIHGLLSQGISGERIIAFDPMTENLQRLYESCHLQVAEDNHFVIKHANVVVLAVKPQVMKEVVTSIAEGLRESKPLVISIAAGISQDSLKSWIGSQDVPVVRVMPNTPGLLGVGATGLYADEHVSMHMKETVELIFRSIGTTLWLKSEDDLHALTAVSGSGPAYFFAFMEAMVNKAIELGMDEADARALTARTCLGAAKMVEQRPEPIATLRQNVTSKGGTTAEGLRVFAEQELEATVAAAMQAVVDRSQAMAEEFK